jgi:cytoskeletal protein RodZ
MYRFIIPLLVALFFLPLTLHAQKEDFQPPKVHQKSTRVKKTAPMKKKEVKSTTKKKAETKAAPVKAHPKQVSEKTTAKKVEKPTIKKTEKPTVKKTEKETVKSARKVERQKVAASKDSTPTPGFIRYIPKTRDTNP